MLLLLSKDYYLTNRRQYISEISVPILYRTKIPFGYVQVNNVKPLTEAAIAVIKRVAMIVEELFKKNDVFPSTDEKMLVSNVSKGGLGIVFKDRRIIRFFKEGCTVFFELILPGNKKATMLGLVRNISIMENKLIKVGIKIEDIDALSEVHYDEFLETIETQK